MIDSCNHTKSGHANNQYVIETGFRWLRTSNMGTVSSSRGRYIIQDGQGRWPRTAELLCIQVNVPQISERTILEPLQLPRLTGSTADIVVGKDAPEHLDNEFRRNISTNDLESNICLEVPFTWGTSRIQSSGVRECFPLPPESQKSGGWIKYD